MSLSLLLGVLLSALSPLAAAEIPILRGRPYTSSRESFEGLVVGIEEGSSHLRTAQAGVRMDGDFAFRVIATGDYALRVGDAGGLTVYQQFAKVEDHAPELEVRLPERNSDRAVAEKRRLSQRELMRPPDRKASGVSDRVAILSDRAAFHCSPPHEHIGSSHPTTMAIALRRAEHRQQTSARADDGSVDSGCCVSTVGQLSRIQSLA